MMMMMDQEDERDRDTQPLAVSLYSPSHTTLAHTLYAHTAHPFWVIGEIDR